MNKSLSELSSRLEQVMVFPRLAATAETWGNDEAMTQALARVRRHFDAPYVGGAKDATVCSRGSPSLSGVTGTERFPRNQVCLHRRVRGVFRMADPGGHRVAGTASAPGRFRFRSPASPPFHLPVVQLLVVSPVRERNLCGIWHGVGEASRMACGATGLSRAGDPSQTALVRDLDRTCKFAH